MDLDALVASDKQAQSELDMANALLRLRDNPDFKKVIEEGYFTELPLAVTRQLASMPIDRRNENYESMLGVSLLHGYFDSVNQKATMAVKTLADNIVAREEPEFQEDQEYE